MNILRFSLSLIILLSFNVCVVIGEELESKNQSNICGNYNFKEVKVSNSSEINEYMHSNPEIKQLPIYGFFGSFDKDYEDAFFRRIKRKLIVFYDGQNPLFSLTGVYVDFSCEDITNNGKLEILAQTNPRGGNASQYEYIISPENSFKTLEIFTSRFGQEILDLNGDGVKEIVGLYSNGNWFQFAGCASCQEPVRRVLCNQGERFKDCTANFTELLQQDWDSDKTRLKSEAIKYDGSNSSSIKRSIGPLVAHFVGNAIKLNREQEALRFIDSHFPKEVLNWTTSNMGKINELISPKIN